MIFKVLFPGVLGCAYLLADLVFLVMKASMFHEESTPIITTIVTPTTYHHHDIRHPITTLVTSFRYLTNSNLYLSIWTILLKLSIVVAWILRWWFKVHDQTFLVLFGACGMTDYMAYMVRREINDKDDFDLTHFGTLMAIVSLTFVVLAIEVITKEFRKYLHKRQKLCLEVGEVNGLRIVDISSTELTTDLTTPTELSMVDIITN